VAGQLFKMAGLLYYIVMFLLHSVFKAGSSTLPLCGTVSTANC